MKPRIAVFPGSFDPITLGHIDIVNRALPLFDKLIIAIGHNSQKQGLYALEKRMNWIELVFQNNDKVEVQSYEGLTIHFCQKIQATHIVRGIRSVSDFDYEKTIAHLNFAMLPEVETLLILAKPEMAFVSSTIVREIIKGKGDVAKFVPKQIVGDL